jgi:hypothetical protein
MTDHRITPPTELVEKWHDTWIDAKVKHDGLMDWISTQAAQWGADQELEACCKWLFENDYDVAPVCLRADRRPKPPSLKEQALEALGRFSTNAHTTVYQMQNDFDLCRRALEALDD